MSWYSIVRRGGTASTPWDPSQLSLLAWYDADAITGLNNGDSVTTWSDSSGNARDISAGTAPTYQTAVLNGRPVIRFTASQYLKRDSSFMFANGSVTIAAIVGGVGSASQTFIITEGSSTSNSPVYSPMQRLSGNADDVGIKMFYRTDSGSSVINHAVMIGPPISNTIGVVVDDGSSIVTTKDGGAPITRVASYTRAATTLNRFAVGTMLRSSPAYGWDGDMAEIVIADSALGTTDRQKLEGYLAHKWGLASNLPVGHPHKNLAPTA